MFTFNSKQIVFLSTLAMSALLAGAALLLTGSLLTLIPGKQIEHSIVKREPAAAAAEVKQEYIPVKGELATGTGKPSAVKSSWSNFRGNDFDAVYKEPVKLRKDAPAPSSARWTLPLGEGFAGAAVRNGRVYILDYDMENKRDALRCLSLDNAEEIWRYSYPVKIKKNHGMSRTIPAVSDKYCVSLGPKCHLLCVDAMTGQEKWFIDLKHTYGTAEPEWYAGQCPFITDKEAVIAAPAGPDCLLTLIDCGTGKEIWRTPNPFGWTMTHSSIIPMDLDGKKTFVYCGKGGVVGVDAADGKILWSTTDWQIEIATCPSPVICPGNRIFCCGGYLSGSVMLQVKSAVETAEQVPAANCKTLFRLKDAVFGSEQQTPILYDNHLFGIRQRDKEFVCLTLDGKVIWHSGSKGRFGGGPYILVNEPDSANPVFLIMDDDGKLTACEATTAGYKPLWESQVLDDHGAWSPMAMVNGLLLLRDQTTMKCIDLKE
ncbi:MAG: PQQ-binding-like beta-propeller repeat protein [Planctomycetaceae bacterium]|nr:PQQ-binding-like beta-propeller repeat protein [Planctomycetaceae bacterium]